MPTSPWLSITKPKEAVEYTAMLTHLPLKHWYDTPRFAVYIAQIYIQLRHTKGLVGFSLKAHILVRDYWTLSVWSDETAIGNYVKTPPHSRIMRKMGGAMGKTAFTEWKVSSAELPLDWKAALTRQTERY